MYSKTLPVFLAKSLCPSPELKYINAFGLKNDYLTLANLKANNAFTEIGLNQASIQCSSCLAYFQESYLKADSQTIWQCPFCPTKNEIKGPSLKVPQNLYFSVKKIENLSEKKILLVICVDYSGSMNCNYFPMSQMGNLNNLVKNGRTFDEIEANHLMTRKNIIINALDNFFNHLLTQSKSFDIRVFTILFNNEVMLLGDCQSDPVKIFGSDLERLDDCLKKGSFSAEKLCSSRFDANIQNKILSSLYNIEPDCSTALGPAIAAGLGVIESFCNNLGFTNTHFFVFTDGKSNNGIGNLDVLDKTGKFIDKNHEMIYKDTEKHYASMNEKALKYYFPFHFISFEDESSMLKVFKNILLKRMNGNLFQIPVKEDFIANKKYPFYGDSRLDSQIDEICRNIFEGKLVRISIHQSPGTELKLFKKNDVHCEKKNHKNGNNYTLKKKLCYSAGEPFIGVWSDFTPEVEKRGRVDIQIKMEFLTLTGDQIEVFVSSFNQGFWNEDCYNNCKSNLKEYCNMDVVKFLFKVEGKKIKDPKEIEQKCEGILVLFKEYIRVFKEKSKKEEEKIKKNEKKDEDDDEEEEKNYKETTNFNKHKEHKQETESSSSENDNEELGDDRKTTYFFYQEKNGLKEL